MVKKCVQEGENLLNDRLESVGVISAPTAAVVAQQIFPVGADNTGSPLLPVEMSVSHATQATSTVLNSEPRNELTTAVDDLESPDHIKEPTVAQYSPEIPNAAASTPEGGSQAVTTPVQEAADFAEVGAGGNAFALPNYDPTNDQAGSQKPTVTYWLYEDSERSSDGKRSQCHDS